MYIVGIDFSILYPGITITKDFESFKHVSVINNTVTKAYGSFIETVNSDYDGIDITVLGKRKSKSDMYHINERNKLLNYDKLTDSIIELILKHTAGSKDIIVSIEGISFGSSGNSLVDISQATGMLKGKLLNYVIHDIEKMFVFSPSSLKNAIGCKGNASKTDIYLKFISDPVIPYLKESSLYKLLKDEHDNGTVYDETKNKGKGEVKSPFMDMIDSTLPIIKLYNLKNNDI